MMDVEPSHGHPVLATGIPVATTVVLHAAISTAIIAMVKPDVPDLVPYWLMSVLGPSATWAVLVIGRAAVWRQPSAFWLGASAGIVVVLSFVTAFLLYIGPIFFRGVPLALIYSAWVLLACAVGVAVVLRLLGRHVDRPIDAEDDPTVPDVSRSEAEPPQSGRV